jgi:hypothetical protein
VVGERHSIEGYRLIALTAVLAVSERSTRVRHDLASRVVLEVGDAKLLEKRYDLGQSNHILHHPLGRLVVADRFRTRRRGVLPRPRARCFVDSA